jgi:hypothetical protein
MRIKLEKVDMVELREQLDRVLDDHPIGKFVKLPIISLEQTRMIAGAWRLELHLQMKHIAGYTSSMSYTFTDNENELKHWGPSQFLHMHMGRMLKKKWASIKEVLPLLADQHETSVLVLRGAGTEEGQKNIQDWKQKKQTKQKTEDAPTQYIDMDRAVGTVAGAKLSSRKWEPRPPAKCDPILLGGLPMNSREASVPSETQNMIDAGILTANVIADRRASPNSTKLVPPKFMKFVSPTLGCAADQNQLIDLLYGIHINQNLRALLVVPDLVSKDIIGGFVATTLQECEIEHCTRGPHAFDLAQRAGLSGFTPSITIRSIGEHQQCTHQYDLIIINRNCEPDLEAIQRMHSCLATDGKWVNPHAL